MPIKRKKRILTKKLRQLLRRNINSTYNIEISYEKKRTLKVETQTEGYFEKITGIENFRDEVLRALDDRVEEVIIKKRTAKQSPNSGFKDVSSNSQNCI